MFPFDRPLPPGEGDNQALAVNTTDGSVEYDVSFSLVWVDDDTATNLNEAYAFASCRGCTTVAVAFQVVLLLGSVDVVVPENIAAAVNYACLDCVTYALATQLVVSLPGPLDEAGTAQLDDIWAELQAFADQIDGLPLAELRDRLTEFESRILAVIQEYAEEAPGDAGGPREWGRRADRAAGIRRDRGADRWRHRRDHGTRPDDGARGDDGRADHVGEPDGLSPSPIGRPPGRAEPPDRHRSSGGLR